MKGLVWIIVIIIIVAGIFYFMSGDEATAPSDEMMSDEVMTDDNSVMTEDENSTDQNSAMEDDNQMMDSEADVVNVTIEGSSFKFAPNMIEANVGDTVEVEFVNVGGFHDFVIDEFDAKTSQISEGETETISFVVDEAGEFEFYCSVGNHRAQGMVGTLIVN